MNILIIGYGSVGKRHAKNLARLGITFFVVEPNITRLNEASTEGYIGYASLDEVDYTHKFDAVMVCSPPAFHIDQTIWALKLGKKVFLEKPMGINLEQCKSLLKYDYKKIFIGYTYQWNPQFRKLKKDIEIGEVGKLYYANFVIGMNLEDWHPWESYQDFFMSSLELGGGALLDESHFIELAIDLFGLPEKIAGTQSKISNLEIETDDYVFAQFQYKNLLVDIKLDLFKRPHESFIQVYGENGSINCDFIRKINVSTTYKSYADSTTNLHQFDYERNDLFVSMIDDFLYFVSSDSEPARVPISRGLDVMLVIDKIREASQNRNWVHIEAV